MAESTPTRHQRTLDAFADDLSSMLNIDDHNDAHRVGDIDEEDTLDLLLVGDDFQETDEDNTMRNAFIDDDADTIASPAAADDDDETLAEILINPGLEDELIIAEDNDFNDDEDDSEIVKAIDEISTPELIALDQVADIEYFDDSATDFVVDITDDPVLTAETFNTTPPPPERTAEILAVTAAEATVQAITADSARHDISSESAPSPGVSPQPGLDPSPELGRLAVQLESLEAQLQGSRREIAEKADRNTLNKCWDELQKLQSRSDSGQPSPAISPANKVWPGYTAIGVAIAGLLLAAFTTQQNLDANTRINDLQQTVSNLQLQAKTAPQSAATSLESIQKQLDELKAVDNVLNSQITEINKTLHKSATAVKTDAVLNKKMAALNSQNEQVDAKLEELENKISALKKKPSLTSVPPPPPPKTDSRKPAGAESWTVNLIAFKQDWIAKRKAEEYANKGIDAKVSKTEAKGENWYRLSVDGFRTQTDANNYAAKVRKNLNLDTVSITHNQD